MLAKTEEENSDEVAEEDVGKVRSLKWRKACVARRGCGCVAHGSYFGLAYHVREAGGACGETDATAGKDGAPLGCGGNNIFPDASRIIHVIKYIKRIN